MKREFLKEMELSDEVINKIMAENGKDIEKAKGDYEKISAELEQNKTELKTAQETLEKFKDYDQTKADIEKYKSDLEKSKADYEKKISEMELRSQVKDFTSSKKFVNDLTRDAINSSLVAALNDAANKGKSIEDLLNQITEGKENIFIEENKPQPPVSPNMNGDEPKESGVLAAFQKLNPNIKF